MDNLHHRYSVIILFGLLILFSSTNLYSQAYNYSGTLSYLDGEPFNLYGADIDDFSVTLIRAPQLYAGYVSDLKNGTITLSCAVTGTYTLKLMEMEIASFEVTKQKDEFVSDLSKRLHLPFNHFIITEPNTTIKIYDDNINIAKSLKANDNGYIALKEDSNYFSNKFFAKQMENGFPQIANFKKVSPSDKGKFSTRRLQMPKSSIKILVAKKGIVYHIIDDIFYTVRKVSFNKDKDKDLWLLLSYNVGLKKGFIHKLDFSSYEKAYKTDLYLDENGNLVIVRKFNESPSINECYSLVVSKNGNLKTDKNTYVYPYYRFKDNFVKNTQWIIPTFKGIALTEGGHNLRISCNGAWTEPDPAARPSQILAGEIDELVKEIDKASQEGRDIGNSKSLLLDEKRKQLSNMPPTPPLSRTGDLVSNESFNVFLSPFSDLFWKMDSPLNKDNANVDSIAYNVKCVQNNPAVEEWNERRNKIRYNRSLDSKSRQEAIENLGQRPTPSCLKYDSTAYFYTKRYRPSGYDPESELAKIDEIKDCIIEVDGKAFNYSYVDPYACKGIMYTDWDSDEQRKEVMAACIRNAPVYMGFEGEMESGYNGWGKGIDLFDKTWDLTSNQPINSWEGPYPELRYGFRETLGKYANMKEARQHCKSPQYNNRSKTYNCYDQKIVNVCLENYQYTVVDNRVITNYEALYCGEMEEEVDPSKGDEIVVVVSADGYITETRALSKRTLEASEILFNGGITDKEGTPIDSAKISLRGMDAVTYTDEFGVFHLFANTGGKEPHSESMNIKLQQVKIEITNEELGVYEDDHFGVVSDGFTTLKLKVKAKGIRPQTVIVKQPELGSFVEQSFLKLPLVLNADGEGEMEYVPPTYLKNDQLTKHLQTKVNPNNQYGLLSQIWVAEVPIEITYEDEEGNPGRFTLKIMVSRPPVFLMHGFTGDEATWATLGNYLRGFKYETYAREYYQGPADESTIQRQSEKLGFYIQKIRESYKAINILQTRIDIVAHSMGGLMSRYYINNMSKYGEKVGVVIPYDVKLSREQLAAARNKAPVNLIDVRKLIMVGTPNHGASKIDEIFGVAGALTSDYHQIANGQLRSDSEFFKILNEGESEGRHLDPNVQYALLYGIRKRSEFYPVDRLWYPIKTSQKEFADNDGVVAVSSAILNGILNIPFPKDWFAMHGFIHSPAMAPFFMGDEAITESTSIFEEIKILLKEDIKRTPLKNSYAKIIRSDGEAFMKYFATENWKAIGPTPVKLRDHWCQIKTDKGSANLGFFLNGHHWGSLHVLDSTIVFYEYASPEFVKVYLQEGKARFRSRKQSGGGFEVIMGDEGEKWYEFNPKAKVRDVNTDFIIEEGKILNVQSINGKVVIGIQKENTEESIGKEISSGEGVSLNQQGEISDNPLPESGWWSDIDTTFLPDEVIEKDDFVEDIPQKSGLIIGALKEVSSDKTKPSGISHAKSNKLPIVNFEIGTVSGGSFEAPVWIKFYPSGTYDPDGKIVLFEMDMDGDGTFDVSGRTLTGGSFEFTRSGEYTAVVRVTDDKGGVTTKSKSFTITDPNLTYSEQPKVYQTVGEQKPTDIELDKKLDSIIEEYKYQGDEPTVDEEHELVYQQVEKSKLKNVALDEKLDSIIEGYKRQDVDPTNTSNEFDIVYKEPDREDNKSEYKTDTSLIFRENLLKNGSFEKGPSVGSFKLFSKGNGIPRWKVTRATVDLVGNYFNSADGSNSLDLNGTSYGEIQQQFSTKKGKQYMLSFYLAGNPGGGPTVKKLLVTVGNKSEEYQFDITGKNVRKMGWEYHELIFTAEDKSTILTFESNHNSGPAAAGPVIDNVKVFALETEEFFKEAQAPKVIITDDSTVQLTADSYVYAYSYRNWNEANFGQSELLSVGWHSTGGEKRSYLKFDLPNISADDLISAQLKLFIKETVGNRSLNFGVHNVLESWEEGFGTFHSGQSEPIDSSGAIIWDYQPKFDDSVFAKFKLRKRRDKSIKVDITTLVKSWLINNSNYGLLLKPQGYLSGRVPTSIYEIYSKEYQDQSKHPIITLDIKK